MAYVVVDEAAAQVCVYSSEGAYREGRPALGAADLLDPQAHGLVWVDRAARVRHFPPQWSSDVDEYATAAVRAAMRRAALLVELHQLAASHADHVDASVRGGKLRGQEWQARCTCGWREVGGRHGDAQWCADETARVWTRHAVAAAIAEETGRPADDPQVAGLARALGYCAS